MMKKIKEYTFLVWYSFKEFGKEFITIFRLLLQARTWIYIFVSLGLIAMYYRKMYYVWPILIAILIVYIIRQKIDGRYKHEMKENAFLEDNEEIIQSEYLKYTKSCFFKKINPLEYQEWKKREIEKIKNSE